MKLFKNNISLFVIVLNNRRATTYVRSPKLISAESIDMDKFSPVLYETQETNAHIIDDAVTDFSKAIG